jgi:malonyl-CoA O-methyltransferase
MLAQARAKPQPAHAHFAAADLTQPWPCAHACADLIVCNLVLEHIRDLVAVFAEAHRVLRPGGQFFICELHPFRQYQGKQATFQRDGQPVEIPAFVHHISVFLNEAQAAGFRLTNLNEWWHETDQEGLPRLVSILFEK